MHPFKSFPIHHLPAIYHWTLHRQMYWCHTTSHKSTVTTKRVTMSPGNRICIFVAQVDHTIPKQYYNFHFNPLKPDLYLRKIKNEDPSSPKTWCVCVCMCVVAYGYRKEHWLLPKPLYLCKEEAMCFLSRRNYTLKKNCNLNEFQGSTVPKCLRATVMGCIWHFISFGGYQC